MTEKNQRWVFHGEVPQQNMGGGLMRRILAYGDALMCVENAFDTGADGAIHSHPHDQITYIASGVFDFHIAGETRRVHVGDTMFIPGGTLHGCSCLEGGAILDIYSPMRQDFV